MIKKITLCGVLFFFFISNNVAFSQLLYCEGQIIKEGTPAPFVTKHCKDPISEQKTVYPSSTGGIVGKKLYFKKGGRVILVEIRHGEVTNISWADD